MKKQTNLITTSIFILILCLGFSVEPNWDGEKALIRVEEFFSNGLDQVQKEIDKLALMLSQEEQEKMDWTEIKNQFALAKESYKRIEFLLEYHDPEGIKKRINGAPLLTVEKHVPEINVLEPKGFQIIEEHLYADLIDLPSLQSLTKTLAHDFDKTKSFQSKIPMEHRHIFEACRLEIIRIFTLGLTGFDTPGSGFALQEALEAMKGVAVATEAYYPGLLKKDKVIHDLLRYSVEDAIFTLAMAKDFDEFDRLAFLKNYLNPIFKHLLAAQNILGIESHKEAVNEATALNFKATNIFAKDFLNADFYANQDPDGALRDKRAALGRLLFYDPILSEDNSLACASCHQPQKAFTDGLPTSLNMPGKRNTPGLINAVYAEKYFYDNRESNLERQVNHVVKDHAEFNTDFPAIIAKLKESKTYKDKFAEAYSEQPNYTLSKWSISDALNNYVTSLTSFDTPFDKYVRGESEEYSESAARGFNLFMGKASCGTCHFAPTFSGVVPPLYLESETEVLGVPASKAEKAIDPDLGRNASKLPADNTAFYKHSFKTTTVRNVAYTAPYMHNGVYENLDELLDFYNRGGGQGLGLDVPYQTLPGDALDLSKKEMADLKAFMESLSDDLSRFKEPAQLPAVEGIPTLDLRVIGGTRK